MAIQFTSNGVSPSDLDFAKGGKPTRFKLSKQAEAGIEALKKPPVDQIAKRDRTVARLDKEIKAIAANPLGKKGRPSSGKVRVTLMLRPETVKAFKAAGMGWQALVSDILDAAAPKG